MNGLKMLKIIRKLRKVINMGKTVKCPECGESELVYFVVKVGMTLYAKKDEKYYECSNKHKFSIVDAEFE